MPETPGHRSISGEEQLLIRDFKAAEQHILQSIAAMRDRGVGDPRWLSIAQTTLEQGFMALTRGVLSTHPAPAADEN